MVAEPFRPLIVGRGLSAAAAVAAAKPLSRLTGLTDDPDRAKQFGVAIAAVDALSLTAALAAREKNSQRHAAILNAATDMALGVALIALSTRRAGSRRLAAAAAGLFVLAGGVGWARAAGVVAAST